MADVRDQTHDLTVNSNGALLIQGYQPAVTAFSGITATGAQTSTSASGYNIATVTLRTFTGTSPSVTWKLQASDDNTNWVDIQGINNSTGQVGVSWTQGSALTAGTAGPSIDYTVGAYTNVRINVTAISGTSATAAFGLAFQTMPYEASPGAVAQGTAANGSATLGNPVLVAGSDGTNARSLKTDSSGNVGIAAVGATGSAVPASAIFIGIQGSTNNTFGVKSAGAAGDAGTGDAQVATGMTIYNGSTWDRARSATGAGTGTLAAALLPSTSGGLSIYSGSITTTVTAIKASAGQLYGWQIGNANASAVYVQLFNAATGSVTLGTTAPTMSLYIPASGGATFNDDLGIAFGTAISVACTTTRTGSTAPGSSVDLNFFYK